MPKLKQQAEELVRRTICGTRKGLASVPACEHSLRVAALLERHGADEETVLAGLLHDVIEDGGVTGAQLKKMGYSDRVVHLVRLCSHSLEVDDSAERWTLMVARLVEAGDADAWFVKLADILDNLGESHALKPDKRRFMVSTKAPLLLRLTEGLLPDSTLRAELQAETERLREQVA